VKALFLTLLFLTSAAAQARDVWIGAVGIDQNIRTQNYQAFYSGAEDFIDDCTALGLDAKTDCRLYINSDPKLKCPSNQDYTVRTGNSALSADRVLAPPTSNLVLNDLRNALKNAKTGDNIVFSLMDHGSPSKTDPSCVYLSSFDTICTSDLKKLLSELKAQGLPARGVKVFIDAEGCFSGAFNGLSSDQVCARTTSDRYRATADTPSFWTQVKPYFKSHPKSFKLSDLRDFLPDLSYPDGGDFTSRVIHQRECRSDSSQLTIALENVTKQIANLNQLFSNLCEVGNQDSAADDFADLNEQPVADIFRQLSEAEQEACTVSPQSSQCAALDGLLKSRESYARVREAVVQFRSQWKVIGERWNSADNQIEKRKTAALEALSAAQSAHSSDDKIRKLQSIVNELDAEGGQLLDEMTKDRHVLIEQLNKMQLNPSYAALRRALNQVGEYICIKHILPEPDGGSIAGLKLEGANLPDDISDTDVAKQRASSCEESFIFH
jgi:hypothetical protein